MGKGVWGLDVSKSSVKAVRLEMRGGTPALTDLEVVPYPGAEAGDGSNLDQQIVDALQELKASCRFGKEPILVSLPGHSTFNRLIKLPPVDDEKIPEIVRYEAQSQIPFNIDEVIWDYQVVEREYEPNEEKEVILFAIKRDIVDQFLANVAPVGLNIESIQFAPVALYNYLAYDQEFTGAAIALDLGGDNTDLVILDGSKFWIRNLPITGNDISKALQKAFNLPFPEAEKLKLKAAQSQQAQKIFNAIQPVLRELVGEIHRSVGYYKSISKTAKFEKIVLLGNGTKTLNFQKFVSQSLSTMGNLPAARLQKLGRINADAIDPGDLNRSLGTLGCALGLALQGLDLTSNRVNLLPPVFLQKKQFKKKQPFIAAAVAVLYLLVGIMWLTMNSEVAKLKGIKGQGDAAYVRYQQLRTLYDAASQVEAVAAPLKTVASLSTERDLGLNIMSKINQCLPENAKLDKDGKPLKPLIQPEDMLWIVDWKFEEEPRDKPKSDNPGQPTTDVLLPTSKNLLVTLEVVIYARSTGQRDDGTTWIIKKILDPEDGKLSVIKFLGLPPGNERTKYKDRGFSWDIVPEGKDFEKPLPSFITERQSFVPDEEQEKKYWRYKVTLTVPYGQKERAAVTAATAPEPPKS